MAEMINTTVLKAHVMDIDSLIRFTKSNSELVQLMNTSNPSKQIQDLVGRTGCFIEIRIEDNKPHMVLPLGEYAMITGPIESAYVLENGVIQFKTANSVYCIQKGAYMDKASLELFRDMAPNGEIEIAVEQ